MATVPPATLDRLSAPATPPAPTSRWSRFWTALEQRLIDLADYANPILVKETRQALKSRQFVVTFLIVLIACWIVSFVIVAQVGPQIYYAAAGPQLLIWYYGILCLPLALIVPFTAFRSLAAEQEENTYDLLSITTLSSRQIIT
ncbi:MAG TPA: ABC transporter permease, partial [Lacipirellula sp.]